LATKIPVLGDTRANLPQWDTLASWQKWAEKMPAANPLSGRYLLKFTRISSMMRDSTVTLVEVHREL